MLKIKAKNRVTSTWEYVDIEESTTIALTFEANPVGELKHRYADASNLIKLPRTQRNNAIMGFAGDILESYNVPYQQNPCKVEMDGITVFGASSYFIITSVNSSHYEIKIFSGIADLFKRLQNTKLHDLPEKGQFAIPRINWAVAGAKAGYTNNTDTPIPIMDWNVEDNPKNLNDGDEDTLPEINVSSLYPCVKLKKLMETICSHHGYTLQTDVANNDLYLNSAVMCTKGAAAPVSQLDWSAQYGYITNNPSTYFLKAKKFYQWIPFSTSGNFYKKTNPDILYYKFPEDGTIIFDTNFDPNNKHTLFQMIFNNANNTQDNKKRIRFYTKYKGNFKVKGCKDDYVSFLILNDSITDTSLSNFWLYVSKFEQEFDFDRYPNNNFSVVKNLPDISCLDAFKQFLLMFGQMVYIDDRNKTVNCYGWDTVYNNRAQGKDWSEKLDHRHMAKNFTFGNYAQKSIIKYKDTEYTDENDKEKTIKSEGTIKVPNKTLEESKIISEFDAYTVDEVSRFGWGNVAKIRHRQGNQPTGDAPFTLVYLANKGDGTQDVIRLNGRGEDIDRDELSQVVVYAKFNEISAHALVSKYYSKLQNCILRKCKIFKERIMLNPADVQKFDHAIPIFLNKYNKYFYINKIDKYSGGLTNVELILLDADIEPK